jgi:hypothetical protein
MLCDQLYSKQIKVIITRLNLFNVEKDMSPELNSPTPARKKSARPSIFQLALAGIFYLVQLVLPVVLAGLALYVGLKFYDLWALDRLLSQVIFGALLIVLSLAIVFIFDSQLAPKGNFKKGSLEYRLRTAKFIIGGVLLPVGAVAAAVLVTLPQGGTAMDQIIHLTTTAGKTTPASLVADSILASEDPSLKLQGIQTLQVVQSDEALDQLLRIVKQDPAALQDASEYYTLTHAVGAYGMSAKTKLQLLFRESPAPTKASSSSGSDLYDRYFSAGIAALKQDLQRETTDAQAAAARLAQLDLAATDLKANLEGIRFTSGNTPSLREFALDAMLAMSLDGDPDLLLFGHETAADETQTSAIRGQALLIIGKYGSKTDLELIYPYLQSKDSLIKQRTMQAIETILSREAGTTQNQ